MSLGVLGQTVDDVFSYPSASFTTGQHIIMGDSGNYYVAGSYDGTVNFDPTSSKTLYGSYDGYVSKHTSSSKLLWVKRFDGGNVKISSLREDDQGNIFIGGYFLIITISSGLWTHWERGDEAGQET